MTRPGAHETKRFASATANTPQRMLKTGEFLPVRHSLACSATACCPPPLDSRTRRPLKAPACKAGIDSRNQDPAATATTYTDPTKRVHTKWARSSNVNAARAQQRLSRSASALDCSVTRWPAALEASARVDVSPITSPTTCAALSPAPLTSAPRSPPFTASSMRKFLDPRAKIGRKRHRCSVSSPIGVEVHEHADGPARKTLLIVQRLSASVRGTDHAIVQRQ